jgi:hypothetical protein
MSNANLRNITNHFQDVRLVSLASWKAAAEITPKDRGGPYVVLQEGFDPEDISMNPAEFVLGRSGKWLSLGFFYQMPVAERRTEFVFGTAAEVMKMMADLPPKVVMMRPDKPKPAGAAPGSDEMAAALNAAKQKQ